MDSDDIILTPTELNLVNRLQQNLPPLISSNAHDSQQFAVFITLFCRHTPFDPAKLKLYILT